MKAINDRRIFSTAAIILIGSMVLFAYNTRDLTEKIVEDASGAQVKSQPLVALEETGGPDGSSHAEFWLNSGGYAFFNGKQISTFRGSLPEASRWRAAYAVSNPSDTDEGRMPQNIFRLLTKKEYLNAAHMMYVNIVDTIESDSPNRGESNGIFIMMRRQDDDNLYYAGLRVDGSAIIKKKASGGYYTLAESPVFAYSSYDRSNRPNLLPHFVWIGLKSNITTTANGAVTIVFSIDIGRSGIWVPILTATDNGSIGGKPITIPGSAGIRSDFMEIEAEDFTIVPSST